MASSSELVTLNRNPERQGTRSIGDAFSLPSFSHTSSIQFSKQTTTYDGRGTSTSLLGCLTMQMIEESSLVFEDCENIPQFPS